MAALLELSRLDKHYGALLHAVAGVSLAIEAGRVHAVVGENGAGKSTLLKMAAGIVAPDAGEVRVQSRRLDPHTAREAIARGVGMVQQHFALVGALTAIENVMLGAEPVRTAGRLDVRAARARAEAAAKEVGASIDWDAPAQTLSLGDRQRLEIVRMLVRDACAVILDEPTAVLAPIEAAALYATLRRMADAGRAVVVVTHRLDEVRDNADVVSVMRRGKLVSTRAMDKSDQAVREITRDIMGDDPPPALQRTARALGGVRIDAREVRKASALRGATLSVRAGEIVGVAGVEGNGQRELVRVLSGIDRPDGGELRTGSVAVVHEDRHAEGLVLDASVRDNLVLGELGSFARFAWVDARSVDREARARMDRAGVVPPNLDTPARALSGGNQQKVVVARAMARGAHASALVFAQPTRGVDLGSARAIHAEIVRAADTGKAVLVVSADLAELRALCDRVVVMARGRIVAELPPDASDARFGEAMLGATRQGRS